MDCSARRGVEPGVAARALCTDERIELARTDTPRREESVRAASAAIVLLIAGVRVLNRSRQRGGAGWPFGRRRRVRADPRSVGSGFRGPPGVALLDGLCLRLDDAELYDGAIVEIGHHGAPVGTLHSIVCSPGVKPKKFAS